MAAKPPSAASAGPAGAAETIEDPLQRAYTEFTLASIEKANGRYPEARRHLEKALEGDPSSAYLNMQMAVLLKGLKDYKEALKFARKSVELKPEDPMHRILLAEILPSKSMNGSLKPDPTCTKSG